MHVMDVYSCPEEEKPLHVWILWTS